jgi:aspartyl-tRNA(Asn)/glutamyl-tRNA(Gln) amidotransferase subunit C
MLSKEEVLKIAKLARLELSEKEVETMQKDLSAVLDYFEILKKIDTSNVKLENKDILDIEKITRKDEVLFENNKTNDWLLNQAPDKKDDYIKVKAIL